MSHFNSHKSMNAEEVITIERKEDLATIRTPEVFYPKSKRFFISFPERDDDFEDEKEEKEEDLTESEENKKIKIRKSDVYQIFKMAGVPNRQLSTYILYLLTLVETEYIQSIPNAKKEYKIDYKMMTKLIKYFYILVNKDEGEDDDGIKIPRDSLLKIFDLLRLSIKDRLKLMEFYEVEADEYSNDQRDRDFIRSSSNQRNKSRSPLNQRDRSSRSKGRNRSKSPLDKKNKPQQSPGKLHQIINISADKREIKRNYYDSFNDKNLRSKPPKGKKRNNMNIEDDNGDEMNDDENIEREEEGEEDDMNDFKPKKTKGNYKSYMIKEVNKKNKKFVNKPKDRMNKNGKNDFDFEDNYDSNEDEMEREEERRRNIGRKGPNTTNRGRKPLGRDNIKKGNKGRPYNKNPSRTNDYNYDNIGGDEEEEFEDEDNYPYEKSGKNRGKGEPLNKKTGKNKYNRNNPINQDDYNEDDDEDNLDYNGPNRGSGAKKNKKGRPNKYNNENEDDYNEDFNKDYDNNLPKLRGKPTKFPKENLRKNNLGGDEFNNDLPRDNDKNIENNEDMNSKEGNYDDTLPKGNLNKNKPNKYGNDEFEQALNNNLPRGTGKNKNNNRNYDDGEEGNDNKNKKKFDKDNNDDLIDSKNKDKKSPNKSGNLKPEDLNDDEEDDFKIDKSKIPEGVNKLRNKILSNIDNLKDDMNDLINENEDGKPKLKGPTKLSKYRSLYDKIKEKLNKAISDDDLDNDDLNNKDNEEEGINDFDDDKKPPENKKKSPQKKKGDNEDDNGSEGVPVKDDKKKKKDGKPLKKGKVDDSDNENPENENTPDLDKNKKTDDGLKDDTVSPRKDDKRSKKDDNGDELNEGDSDDGLPLKDQKLKPKTKKDENKDDLSDGEKDSENDTEPKDKKRKDKKMPPLNKKTKSKDKISKDGEDEDEPDKNKKLKPKKSKDKLLKRTDSYDIDEPNDDGTEKESKLSKKKEPSKGSINVEEEYEEIIYKEESNRDNKPKPKKKLIKKKIPKKKGPLPGEEEKPTGKKPKKSSRGTDEPEDEINPDTDKLKDKKGKKPKPKNKLDKLKPKDESENDSEKGNETDKSPLGNDSDINNYKKEEEQIEIEITEEVLHNIPENKKHDIPENSSEIEVGSESFVVPYVDPREHHKRKKSDIGMGTAPINPEKLRNPKLKHRPSHHFRGSIDANTCLYHFIHRKKEEYGDWPMYLVGNLPQLGNDNIKNAIKMDEEIRNGQKFYSKYVPVKDDKFPFHYRYFFNKNGEIVWLTAPDTFIAHKQFFDLLQNLRNNVISIFDLNIRYLNNVDEQNIWDLRKDQLIQVILNAGPDILFFQEITKIQFEFIDDNLGSVYDFVGMYRDSTDRSEKCSISYNKFKYTLNDWGQFWLSSTPSVPGSNDFNNFFPRICTWCTLKQLEGVDFAFFNIHLDHVTFEAHMPCIEVALQQMNNVLTHFPETQAIYFGGCFYCEVDDPIIDKIKSHGFILVPFENTFHDFTGDGDRHWDYLFWKPYHKIGDTSFNFNHSVVDKQGSTINRLRQQYISDHYPYYAEFDIKGSKFDNQSVESEEDEKSN